MNQTTKWIIGAVVVVAIVVVGYSMSKGPSKPVSTESIKIGVITPLTGDAAVLGEFLKNTTDLAVEEINLAGGVNGQNLECDKNLRGWFIIKDKEDFLGCGYCKEGILLNFIPKKK